MINNKLILGVFFFLSCFVISCEKDGIESSLDDFSLSRNPSNERKDGCSQFENGLLSMRDGDSSLYRCSGGNWEKVLENVGRDSVVVVVEKDTSQTTVTTVVMQVIFSCDSTTEGLLSMRDGDSSLYRCSGGNWEKVNVLEREDSNYENEQITYGKGSSKSIRAAKEMNFSDGTKPAIAWYLVADPTTNKFYKTKDFNSLQFLFSWTDSTSFMDYSFGILPNDDIIAVFRTETINPATGSNDDVRKNPFVFLALENYSAPHIVDFGSSKKPSGWVRNTGMRVLPDGTTVFCEYTRPSVATANVWRIANGANILNPSSWKIVKTFDLSGSNYTGFKHCHCIMWDFYSGTLYLTTGDDNVGAQVWHSMDKGVTWTQTRVPSEKYCRMINFNFTQDFIYWATDTAEDSYHFVMRAPRDSNGVIDYSKVEELAQVPHDDHRKATYGTSLFESAGVLLLNERCDGYGDAVSMPVLAFDLQDMTLKQVSTIYSATGTGVHLGFRTDFTELYDNGGKVHYGFGKAYPQSTQVNYIKGFGNAGNSLNVERNVNTLFAKVYRHNQKIVYELGTYYY